MSPSPHSLQQIVSGGQTGVDRGALDAAIELAIPHGGWCPFGRKAEDGTIPARYQVKELVSPQYHVRTEQNVIDSDATLILTQGPMSGGTELTYRLAAKHRRPCLVVNLQARSHPYRRVQDWLKEHRVAKLNVAGPRESASPGLQEAAKTFLLAVLRSE